MPSSTDRKRLEIPTYLHDRLVEIAIDEDRTVASVAQQIIDAGLAIHQPGLIAQVDTSHYSPRALAALDAARAETVQFNHNFIGTEHVLLGLLKIEEGIAARVLGNLAVDHARVLAFMQTHLKQGKGAVLPLAELRLAPRAKRALQHAAEEAEKLDGFTVGTEHILLGLTRVRDGIAARILVTLGVFDAIRDETRREMGKYDYVWEENQYGIAPPAESATSTEEQSDVRRDRATGEAGGA